MIIRPADPEDAPRIASIWNHVIRETVITFTTDAKSEDDIHKLIAERTVLVITHSERLVGFAYFGPFRTGPGYADTAEITIYLEPTATGQGAGAPLLFALEDAARSAGILTCVAGISGTNAAAQRFFQRHGYVQTGHLPEIGKKFGARHDLILMQKKLPNPT